MAISKKQKEKQFIIHFKWFINSEMISSSFFPSFWLFNPTYFPIS